MRQVDVRVMSPAARYQVNAPTVGALRLDVRNVPALVMLCLFWGVVLYLGLVNLV